ncbi:replicative DNA helicase [Cohnella yongneupensis]|uniref:DNA 5'-3' helicase n=1 Tax=Cohnella yongneupensis TaxID=425006 RepID=A0ABW0QUG7_9BACL
MEDLVFQAECMVLGSIIMEPDFLGECTLQPDDFEANIDDRHQKIMEYLRYLEENDIPITVVSMAEQSGKNLNRIGGMTYLLQLTSSVPTLSPDSFSHYQKIVRDASIHRKAMTKMAQVMQAGASGNVKGSEFISAAQAAVEELIESNDSKEDNEIRKMSDVLINHDKEIKERKTKRGLTGAKTVSHNLDRLTGGHQDEDLEIVAARPSIGKTAYVVNDMLETARAGRPPLIFSLEMQGKKIAERFICAIGNIDSGKLRNGAFDDSDWERWSYAITELERLPIYIDDNPDTTLQDIARKVKQMKKKHPNLVVYVDFLQLVSPGKRSGKTHEDVSAVSRGLKRIARKNKCPVVAISAVGRGVEQRTDKRPMMSDLRESGSIESDADIVIFLYRDDYYDRESAKKGILEVNVAKGRNVGVGMIEMFFNRQTGRILDLDPIKREEMKHQNAGANSNGRAVPGHSRKDTRRSKEDD